MAIVFDHKGTQYTLEFTRDSIKQMERTGFSLDVAQTQPMTSLLTLFKGAFIAHHPVSHRAMWMRYGRDLPTRIPYLKPLLICTTSLWRL